MRNVPAIDANVILRFLTNDDPAKARSCAALLEKVESSQQHVWLPDLVLADVVWTLEKYYRQSKDKVAELLIPIVSLRGLHCSGKETVFEAFRLYAVHNIDWTDAFVAAQILTEKIPTIYSYDRDFDRVSGLSRVEP